MTTAYTSLLGLALPVTGELQGTWGDTVNNSITSLLDTAVAGTTTLSTDGDVTLTTTTGASNQARQAILLCSGSRTALRTITAPAASKIYTIINATTGGYAVKIVGVGPTTGVTVPAGAKTTVAWNGSDFVELSSFSSLTLNNGTANSVVYLNASKAASTNSYLKYDGTGLLSLNDGTAPPAWLSASSSNTFQVGGGSLAFEGNNATTTLGQYAYQVAANNSTGWRVQQLNVTPWQYQLQNGVGHVWRVGSTGAAGSTVTWTNLMRLDSTGGSTLAISGAGQRGVDIVGGGSGAVKFGGDGTSYAVGAYFYDNYASMVTPLSTILCYGNSGTYEFMSMGGQTYDAGTMYLDGLRNSVGIGYQPNKWNSDSVALQISKSNRAGLVLEHYRAADVSASNGANIGVGWYRNTSTNEFRYSNSFTKPLIYGLFNGLYTWGGADAGTAGNVITFTTFGTLDRNASSAGYGTFTLNGSSGAQIAFQTGGTTKSSIFNDSTSLYINNLSAGTMYFQNNGATAGFFDANRSFIVAPTAQTNYASATTPYFQLGGDRSVIIDASGGFMSIRGSAGGWAVGSYFYGSSGTYRGGFGCLGSVDSLTYYWVGTAYNGTGVLLNYGTTSWGTLSDAREKTVHGSIENALEKIAGIDGVYYNLLSDSAEERRRVGFIAQDVLAVLPEAVTETQREIDNPTEETKRYVLSYTEVIPLLLNGVKEQQALIAQLRADIEALKGN